MLEQARVKAWAAAGQPLVLICGRYEGVDERVLAEVDEEVSLGDFILTGGELAALAVVDAVARLIPGVLGNEGSAATRELRGRPAGASAVHPPPGVRGARRAGHPPGGQPCTHRPLAPLAGLAA